MQVVPRRSTRKEEIKAQQGLSHGSAACNLERCATWPSLWRLRCPCAACCCVGSTEVDILQAAPIFALTIDVVVIWRTDTGFSAFRFVFCSCMTMRISGDLVVLWSTEGHRCPCLLLPVGSATTCYGGQPLVARDRSLHGSSLLGNYFSCARGHHHDVLKWTMWC